MRYLDIFMIMLLLGAVSIVIGLNIVSVVDKKLSNVQIKIPPFPKPNIILNVKKTGLDSLDISVSDVTTDIQNEDSKEHFYGAIKNDVSGSNSNEAAENYKNYPAYLPSLAVKQDNNVTNPDERDVVDYGEYVCYKKDYIKKPIVVDESDKLKQTCQNESINKRYRTGDEQMKPFSTCHQKSWFDVDPANYYKKYHAYPLNINDPKMKGYNDSNYVSSAGIYEVGKIRLDDHVKWPKPNNYSFKS